MSLIMIPPTVSALRRLLFLVQVISTAIYSLMGLKDWLRLALQIIHVLSILNQSPNPQNIY